jgi:predicted dienelactone hydrolase
MNWLSLAAVLPASLLASFALAEPRLHDMAARTELHSIDTLTLSDAQFLSGDTNGKVTTTAGQLRIATGSGRMPVVVLQHGSGGMAGNIEMWAREFSAMGVCDVPLPDSCTAAKLGSHRTQGHQA